MLRKGMATRRWRARASATCSPTSRRAWAGASPSPGRPQVVQLNRAASTSALSSYVL